MIKKCLICKKEFKTYQSRINTGKGKFCSRKCDNIFKLGRPSKTKGFKRPLFSGSNHPMWGKKHSKLSLEKMSKAHKGKNLGNTFGKGKTPWNKGKQYPEYSNEGNGNWKGDKVGYHGIHHWVKRHKGKATKCEFCNKERSTPKSIQWANVDHKYRRVLSDYISLCVSCHRKYDMNFNGYKSDRIKNNKTLPPSE